MRRHAPFARLLAAALRPRPRPPAAAPGLSACPACGRDFVTPVAWEPVGDEAWWISLRCAECGHAREVTVPNAVAERFDDELAAGFTVVARAAARLERERMAAESEAFIAALRRGLIDAGDFAA